MRNLVLSAGNGTHQTFANKQTSNIKDTCTIFPFVFDTGPIKTKVRDPLQGLAESLMIYNNLQPQFWCLSPDFLLVLTTLGSLSSTWRTLEQPPLSHITVWDSSVLILTIHCPRLAIAANSVSLFCAITPSSLLATRGICKPYINVSVKKGGGGEGSSLQNYPHRTLMHLYPQSLS